MADDSLLSLYLKVEGGEASAAEIDDLKGRLEALDTEVDNTQADISSKFSQKFEHIALRGFLADGARAVGLGGELRPVLTALQMGLVGVDEAMGPWLLALAAVGGLLYTIHEHSEKQKEDLEDSLKGYQDNTGAVDAYVAAGGRLSAALRAAAESEKQAAAEALKGVLIKNQEKVAADDVAIGLLKFGQRTEALDGTTRKANLSLSEYTAELKKLTDALKTDQANVDANKHGQAEWHAEIKDGTKALEDRAAKVKAFDDANKKLADENDRDLEKYKRSKAHLAEIDAEAAKKHRAMLDGIIGGDKAGWDEIEQLGIKAMAGLENSTSSTLAKCIVEHQNFAQATKYIWRDLSEQIIADMIKMEEQALIIKPLFIALGLLP